MSAAIRKTLGEELAWRYACFARSHVALKDGAVKFTVLHHSIRAKLFAGLTSNKMQVTSFFTDEKDKLKSMACCYCASTENLSLDHLIPRKKLGSDLSENLLPACRICNSSKGEKDMLSWLRSKNMFPSMVLLRRYLKLIYFYCQENELMNIPLEVAFDLQLPFDFKNLRGNLQPLYNLSNLSIEYCVSL